MLSREKIIRLIVVIRARLGSPPVITDMDDSADLVSLLHTDYSNLASNLIASMEETTTGVIRLRALEKDGALQENP